MPSKYQIGGNSAKFNPDILSMFALNTILRIYCRCTGAYVTEILYAQLNSNFYILKPLANIERSGLELFKKYAFEAFNRVGALQDQNTSRWNVIDHGETQRLINIPLTNNTRRSPPK